MLAGIGFVLWVAIAAVFCTLAATPITWSGLGAALVLTIAAALAERRHRRALPVLLRGSLAFVFAAMLGIATFVGT
jgi:Na+-translocating ferredoxin:NAD+ oxidoreductase RnfA subunit